MSRRKSAMSVSDYNLNNLQHTSNTITNTTEQASNGVYNNPYDTSWVDNLHEVDFLIKEYLIFRGYHKTWEQFYRERKRDQTKNKNIGGYQVDLIVDQLIGYIRNLKLSEYLDFWNTLNLRIFNKLPPQYRESIYHLDTALKRYYLITARKRNNIQSIQTFFNKFGDELISRPDANDWMKWFILPHIKHPEKHQEFESYFNKNWSYSVQISLKNFLSTALCRFPRPKILAFMILKQERQEFKTKITKLTEKLNDADFIIRSLHQQLKLLMDNKLHNGQANNEDDEEHYETNKLINKAIAQYQSDNFINSRIKIQSEVIHTKIIVNKVNKIKVNPATVDSNKKNKSLQINEKYFKSGVSGLKKHPQILAVTENRHRKTIPEAIETNINVEKDIKDNNDDVKAFNDSILFNSRPLTPTRASKSGLFKLPGWLRGKSTEDKTSSPNEAPKLVQTEEVLTPTNTTNTIKDNKTITDISDSKQPPIPLHNIPSKNNINLQLHKSSISMKTIFVPGVPINSVKFNDNGQRLAYSTEAGVIQVYEFPPYNTQNNDKKLSPSLLHTFCVSKPNEILQLCWDSMDDNRLFIAIGSSKKNDDHIQIWNVGDKKCEYIITFSNCVQCNNIEYIKNNNNNRLVVCGYDNDQSGHSILYLYGNNNEQKQWNLMSKSSMMETVIKCVEFNHNGKIMIVGGSDGYIRIFDIKNGYFTQLTKWNAHSGHISAIYLCHDTNSIVSIAKDFCVKHWQLNKDNNSCKRVWRFKENDEDIVPLLCLGPNNYFAVTQAKANLNVNVNKQDKSNCNSNEENGKKDGEEKEEKNSYVYNVIIKNIEGGSGGSPDIVVGGHSKIITAIDWHKESQMLATCSVDGTLRIFQIFPR